MAITKTAINNDFNILQSFLQSSGLFGSVELSENTITMKDSDGNTTIATIDTNITITAYANSSTYIAASYSQYNGATIQYGYKCANGIILPVTGNSNKSAHIMVTKTNNNKVAFTFTKTHINGAYAYTNYFCVAWGDIDVSEFSISAKASEQTLMCPFCTNANLGGTSYTPNAFWMPFGQYYNMGYGTLTMNGVAYLTNGYWCIKDA